MPFEHAATTEWGRWLRRVFAGRAPGTQVVGQQFQDELQATVKVADLVHLATPVGWAQGAVRRESPAGGVGTVSRFEFHCLSAGGLWIQSVRLLNAVFFTIEQGPISVTNRTGIQDYGVIPTVSELGVAAPTESVPVDGTFWDPGGIDQFPTTGLFLPFGKVLKLTTQTGNTVNFLQALWWTEIPEGR